MGGTFDPIHHGHLVAASEVQSTFDLDEVVFVPTGRPYQKDVEEVTSAEHRYLMTVIATASTRASPSPGPTSIARGRPTRSIRFVTWPEATEPAQRCSSSPARTLWLRF